MWGGEEVMEGRGGVHTNHTGTLDVAGRVGE